VFELSEKADKRLTDLLEASDSEDVKIFSQGKIACLDCLIEIHLDDKDDTLDYRIMIFDDYLEDLNDAPDEAGVCVGVVVLYPYMSMGYAVPIIVAKDILYCSYELFPINLTREHKKGLLTQLNNDIIELREHLKSCLATWYGLQIALNDGSYFEKPVKMRWGTTSKSINVYNLK
jgi:hypothetical protein